MIYLTFLIPVFTCVILFVGYRSKTVWWEYFVVFLPSIGASFLTEWAIEHGNANDTEYLGTYATAVKHYDAWDEWIKQTCTRHVKVGKTSVIRHYDCSYRLYHPERWVSECNDGYEQEISRSVYDIYSHLWRTPMEQIDMHRRYYRLDGDAQRYAWSGEWIHALTYTESHSYENRLQASHSLFRFSDISKKEAAELGLYEYPRLWIKDAIGVERRDQLPVMGAEVADSIGQYFCFINGRYGRQYEFRIYVLLFPEKPAAVAQQQRDYWRGGNKNELVVCIGTDSALIRTRWVDTFSWCDDKSLEAYLKQHLVRQDTLNLIELGNQTIVGLHSGLWHRKNFSDFNYVKIEMSAGQYFLFAVIVALINVLLGAWVVKNGIDN